MDDFGTGYSSLVSLNLFPLDTVKIDRRFIERLEDEEDSASIVAAIVMLSKALNMNVTGEGIETEGQMACLKKMGCHTGQGYYFAKPLPADHLAERLASGLRFFFPADQQPA